MKIITTPIQIRFSDVDMAHHVHNAVYLQWFELGRMGYLDTVIPKDHDWRTQGLILARNEVDYRMPVRLRDMLVAEVWCSSVGSKSFDLSYIIRRTSGDQPGICAEGRSVMVCFDYTEQHTIPVPAEWRRQLEDVT
ncbi:MAG: thioesterase family protein [Flavobacteriales bacterium]